jgi:hypothetical protein
MTVEANINRQIIKTARLERIQKHRPLSPREQEELDRRNVKYVSLTKNR